MAPQESASARASAAWMTAGVAVAEVAGGGLWFVCVGVCIVSLAVLFSNGMIH
jgi:hypothetical protein